MRPARTTSLSFFYHQINLQFCVFFTCKKTDFFIYYLNRVLLISIFWCFSSVGLEQLPSKQQVASSSLASITFQSWPLGWLLFFVWNIQTDIFIQRGSITRKFSARKFIKSAWTRAAPVRTGMEQKVLADAFSAVREVPGILPQAVPFQ